MDAEQCDANPQLLAKHCFCQSARIQHAVPNHLDLMCCWCGQTKCIQMTERQKKGHGPYARETVGLDK